MPIINSIVNNLTEAAEWRQKLHENPGTAYEEDFAANLVKEKLTEWGIPFKSGIATTGIVATIEGQRNTSGRAIGLRADMDALNIEEETNLPYASKNKGKMHACGHDGHTATLLATAKYLAKTQNFDGKVHLIFQPAEEGEGGAQAMIDEGLFKEFPCNYVFALHNFPWLKTGEIATRIGPFWAAVDTFKIKINGCGGHAALPHQTIDPLIIACHITTAFQTIISRIIDPVDKAVISVTNLNAGTGAHNIIPCSASMMGTVRTFKQETRRTIKEKMNKIATNIAESFGATLEIEHEFKIDPTINAKAGVEIALKAAHQVVDEAYIHDNYKYDMTGEDFGAFLLNCPGAYILIGQGTDDANSPHNQGLHSPFYDFNDETIPIGASLFAKIVEDYLELEVESYVI